MNARDRKAYNSWLKRYGNRLLTYPTIAVAVKWAMQYARREMKRRMEYEIKSRHWKNTCLLCLGSYATGNTCADCKDMSNFTLRLRGGAK